MSDSKMVDEFIVPPFSVFNTQTKYWKDRQAYWEEQGLYGNNGRVQGETGLAYDNVRISKYVNSRNKNRKRYLVGTSRFSPVVTEVVYKWFMLHRGMIFDPFAGGVTRGALAAIMGHRYVGCDINPKQVDSNKELWHNYLQVHDVEGKVKWLNKDCKDFISDTKFDLVFTCPPYYNLEVYTDNPDDLSRSTSYKAFLLDYGYIIQRCYKLLKDNRFMVWVVSDVRDKKTTEYYGLVADTIKFAQQAGFKLYNEIVLYNSTGNLAMTSGDYMRRARKVGRQHQNILVFYKGDIKKLKSMCQKVNERSKRWAEEVQ